MGFFWTPTSHRQGSGSPQRVAAAETAPCSGQGRVLGSLGFPHLCPLFFPSFPLLSPPPPSTPSQKLSVHSHFLWLLSLSPDLMRTIWGNEGGREGRGWEAPVGPPLQPASFHSPHACAGGWYTGSKSSNWILGAGVSGTEGSQSWRFRGGRGLKDLFPEAGTSTGNGKGLPSLLGAPGGHQTHGQRTQRLLGTAVWQIPVLPYVGSLCGGQSPHPPMGGQADGSSWALGESGVTRPMSAPCAPALECSPVRRAWVLLGRNCFLRGAFGSIGSQVQAGEG